MDKHSTYTAERITAVTRDLGFGHQLKLSFVFESSVFNRKLRRTFSQTSCSCKPLSATLTPTVVTLTDRHETDRQCNFGDIGR